MSLEITHDFPLARLTTVRTGGNARAFAKPASEEEVVEALRWAAAEGLDVEVVGSGSNLLVADEGVDALVIKLDGELTAVSREGNRVSCGGGTRLPSVAAKTANWELTGIEFGVNIPGTVGGAVRMNANAYGGRLADVLESVVITTADGSEVREPSQLGFVYRNSNLEPGEIVTRAVFLLEPAPKAEVQATLADLRSRRQEAQPKGIKTFGSTFKNPDPDAPGAEGRTAGQLLQAAGCNGLAVGGARFAPKHANFVENTGDATTAEILALMAEGRRRVLENSGVVLEPEVQMLGPISLPPVEG